MKNSILSALVMSALVLSDVTNIKAQTKQTPAMKAKTKQVDKQIPCKAPSKLEVTPTEKGFTAKWDAVESAKAYQVYIKDLNGKHNVNSYGAKTNTFSTNSLVAETNFEVYVETKGCATSPNLSPASNHVSFKTLGTAKKTTENTEPVSKQHITK